MSDKYIGDFKKGQVLRVKFNTFSQAILPTTPSVTPEVAIYKDSATEFITGVTQPSVDFDGKAGFHELVIDTSDAVYEVGKDYDIVFTAGTVDSKDLTRTILRTFSIENRNTDANVTKIAGQTASAAAPVEFPASVASPTNITSATGIVLSGVTHTGAVIPTVTDVTTKTGYTATVSDKTGFSLLAGTGLGNQNGSVATVTKVDELGENALTANNAAAEVTAAVWDAQYNQHTTAGSFGKLMDILRKANTVVEGTVTSAVTPTATSFSSNVNYPTGAFKHAVLVFVNSAAIDEQNSPILGYVNTNGVFTVEEAFTTAPTVGDEFIVIPTTHVHSVAAIADGVWDEPTSGHTTAGTTGKALIDSGAAGNPWTTDLSTGYSGTEAGNILNEVKAKTDTITTPTINVYPVSASTPERVAGTTLTFYRDESRSVSVVTDFTLTSLTLQFTVEDQDGNDVYALANASISRSGQTFTVAITTAVTGGLGQYRWSMRDITGGGSSVIAMGVLTVQEAASNG